MKAIMKDFQNIVWLCRPYWKYGKLYMILSFLILVLHAPVEDMIYVRFPEMIIHALSDGKPFLQIAVMAAVICGISFINNILPNVFYSYFTKKQEGIGLKVKRDIYEKAMQIDYKYIDNPDYYDRYAWAMNEYANQTSAAREFTLNICQYFASITVLISIIATIGPWILVIEAAQMAIHAIINVQVNQNSIKEKNELVPIDRRLHYFHRLFYMKDYAADMKATPLSHYIFRGYDRTGESRIRVTARYARKAAFWGSIHELIFFLTELVIVLYLVHSIVAGRILEVGMYMTMMLAFYRVDSKLYGFIGMLQNANSLSLNAEKIRRFFDIQPEIEGNTHTGKRIPAEGSFSVAFKNVGFTYENANFRMSKCNIVIKPGEKIAIVGENGAGKSTLVKLLLRLYDVSEGVLLINGIPIQAYDLRALRQKIGVAFQNTHIYAMSLAENIALYGETSETILDDLFEKLGLHSIFEKQPVDYGAELTREFDENGIVLSGGETQKMALARVMNQAFGLLLLDEP